jgi:hypothetical protein
VFLEEVLVFVFVFVDARVLASQIIPSESGTLRVVTHKYFEFTIAVSTMPRQNAIIADQRQGVHRRVFRRSILPAATETEAQHA